MLAPAGTDPSLPIELAALKPYIDPALFEAAARRAVLLQIGGDEVVRAHGLLPPDEIAEALAEHLGLEIDLLDDDALPDSERILEAARTGVLRRIDSGGLARTSRRGSERKREPTLRPVSAEDIRMRSRLRSV